MKILIYKPGWKIRFNISDNTYVLVNPEVKNLYNILVKKHIVHVVSNTDLKQKLFNYDEYDIKILFCGRLFYDKNQDNSKLKEERKKIKKIFNNNCKQYYFITDLELYNRNKKFLKKINFINITQSQKFGLYGGLEKLFLYNNNFLEFNNNKKEKLIYIGNQRFNKRNDKIKKYLLQLNADIYGDWKCSFMKNYSNYKGKIKFKTVPEKLNEYWYGLCITDKSYRKNNFITPRFYEYILSNVIVFCDKEYDKDEILIKYNDFRIVKNVKELEFKINKLNNDKKFRNRILKEQKKFLINNTKIEKYIYNILKC